VAGLLAAGAALALVLAPGCADLMDQILGSKGGLLLYGFDAATTPGTQINLQARLVEGGPQNPQSGRTVRFLLGEQLIGSAATDGEGLATIQYTPTEVRDYEFTVEIDRSVVDSETKETKEEKFAAPVPLLVACRKADAPIAIVDLDKTLVASGFWDVFSKGAEDPEPMPGSEAVMQRIAKSYFVVYLTHRPDYFAPKSKTWLKGRGYPQGPLLTARVTEFITGSGRFKTAAIETLAKTFSNLKVGIGDKTSDVEAYVNNKMLGVLVLPAPESPKASDLEKLADELDALPADVQVVESWDQAEKVIFDSADFRRAKRVDALRKQAAAVKTAED
jgi:hypothetical protein